jgi:predicted HTH domain antitoxin
MVTIPLEFVRATKMTDMEIMQEIAIMLFQKEKLTLGQAARLAGIPQYQFQMLLSSRDISIHYDLDDYHEDLNTIQSLGL